MVDQIRIYVEGCGEPKEPERKLQPPPNRRIKLLTKQTEAGLRAGFRSFFKSLDPLADRQGINIQLIMCGGRKQAYHNFLNAIADYPNAFNVLLVDSEDPVSDINKPWQHLKNREEDKWDSKGIDDGHCHLMVQAMEAWFIVDLDTLRQFYGEKFMDHKIIRGLEQNYTVDRVSVYNLEHWLKQATKDTSRGKYSKTKHAPKLLELLNVDLVRQNCPSCDRLFKTIEEIIKANP